ncbi:MAG: hypothetical protein AB8B84_06505 [Granulosicoccus sp.]
MIIRSCGRLIFLSMCFVILTERVSASEGLEGMRLFFTADERSQRISVSDVEVGTQTRKGVSTKQSIKLAVSSDLKAKEAVERTSRKSARVVFDAVVSVTDDYLLIINDLPCRVERKISLSKQSVVLCGQSELSYFRLSFNVGTSQLDVYRGEAKVASLAVGERL